MAEVQKKLNNQNKLIFDDISNQLSDYIKAKPTFSSKPLEIPITKIKPLINESILNYYSQIYSDIIEEQFDIQLDFLVNDNCLNFEIMLNNTILK